MADNKDRPKDGTKDVADDIFREEATAAFQDGSHEIDFLSFVMSLATSALLHLGETEGGAAAPVDLPLAKQTIDIIGMLREKTRGNLTSEEERVVEGVLYDLRMRYLKQSRG